MRFMYMPDSTIQPLFVEKQQVDKRRGVLGMASKFFGKDTKQNALLTMLINGGLDLAQMDQIRRAVVLGFKDAEVRDLINSNLSAEDMNGIVDVIYADKHRGKKEG